MKKTLLILIFLFSIVSGYSQSGYINTTTVGNNTTLFKSKGYLGSDTAFIFLGTYPDTATANFSGASLYRALIMVGTDLYYRTLNPNKWNKINSSAASLVSILQGFGLINTPNPITTTGTVAVDTGRIPTRYTIDSVGVVINNGAIAFYDSLLLYLKKSDTLNMLAPYLRKSDTASMLLPYALKGTGDFIQNQIGSALSVQNAKYRISDSAWAALFIAPKGYFDSVQSRSSAGAGLYTNSGTLVAHWGAGGGNEIDFKGFAGYDANRSSSYTVRSFTDKNYVDSSVALRLRISDTSAMLSGNYLRLTGGNLSGQLNGTNISLNGSYTTTTTSSNVLTASTATTSHKAIRLENTSGFYAAGVEGSTGNSIFNGSFPYSSVFGSVNNRSSQWGANNTIFVTLDSTGKLGVNELNPSATLDVSGTTELNGATNVIANGVTITLNSTNSNNYKLRLQDNGTDRTYLGSNATNALEIANGSVTQVATINATTGAYTATSDSSAKKNIRDAGSALALLKQIKVRQYDWKENNSHEPFGVVAQELYKIAPTYVSKPVDSLGRWGVQKAELVPMLIKSIQEQQSKIESLESRLTRLEELLKIKP